MTEYVRFATIVDGDIRHHKGSRHNRVYPFEWIALRICDAATLVTGCRPITAEDHLHLGEANERYTHVVRFTWFGVGMDGAGIQHDNYFLTTFDALDILDKIKEGVDQSIVALGGDA